MKKLVTLLAAIAVALSLSMPAYAQHGGGKKTPSHSGQQGKAHEQHAKKKGAHEGKKKGQHGTNPSDEPPKH